MNIKLYTRFTSNHLFLPTFYPLCISLLPKIMQAPRSKQNKAKPPTPSLQSLLSSSQSTKKRTSPIPKYLILSSASTSTARPTATPAFVPSDMPKSHRRFRRPDTNPLHTEPFSTGCNCSWSVDTLLTSAARASKTAAAAISMGSGFCLGRFEGSDGIVVCRDWGGRG